MDEKKSIKVVTDTVTALFEISNAVNTTDSLDALYAAIHVSLNKILNLENFAVAIYHKEKDSITLPYFVDEMDTNPGEVFDISKKQSLTARVINTGIPLIFNEEDIQKMSAVQTDPLIGSVCKVWAGAPLKIRGQSVGALIVQSYRSKDAFKKTDLDLLCSVSEQIAVAIERKRAEEALKESEARFRALIDHSYDAVLIYEPDGRLIDVNKTMLKMFNVTRDEALRYMVDDYTGPKNSMEEAYDYWVRALTGEAILFPWQARRPGDGSLFDVEVYLTRIISGERKLILFNIRDITERKKAEDALQVSEEKYRLLFENSVEGIYQTSPEGRFISANPSFLKLFGFNSPEELFEYFKDIGKEQYLNPEDRVTFRKIVEAEGFVRDFETQLRKKDGTPIWVSLNSRAVRDNTGALVCFEGFMKDITEKKQAEQELYRVSIHDHLTNIFNRRYVFERLENLIKEHQREGRDFSLCIVDLDFFKKINDTHGHPAGDFILREFAGILSGAFRSYDLVGRYGGEEFVVVAMNIDILQTQSMLERLREMISGRSFDFNGTLIRFTFSAGIANTAETGLEITVDALIRKADERLYLAKEQGRDRIVYESSNPGASAS